MAWIRVLSQISGSPVYAFGLMLSVFIAGVGLGREVATRLLKRMRSVLLTLIGVEIAASVYTLFLVNYSDHLPLVCTYFRTGLGLMEFSSSFVINVAIISVVLLFRTLMFGAAFPLVAAVYARDASRSGGDVGAVYALNTVGGVVGSFVGGRARRMSLPSSATSVCKGFGLEYLMATAFDCAYVSRTMAAECL